MRRTMRRTLLSLMVLAALAAGLFLVVAKPATADSSPPDTGAEMPTDDDDLASAAAVDKVLKIAFTSARDGNYEVYAMNPDGENQTNLTNVSSASDFEPAFSPDGKKIAFLHRAQDGSKGLYVMGADGSNQTNLTSFGTKWAGDPVFSPDGTKIAFFRQDGDGLSSDAEIYTVNVDGSNPTNLTNSPYPGQDYSPAFSPDGTKIAFERWHGCIDICGADPPEIYVMDADGSNQTRLTYDYEPKVDADPAWGLVSQTPTANHPWGDLVDSQVPRLPHTPVIRSGNTQEDVTLSEVPSPKVVADSRR